jgi:iron complex transport system substrate-binding protein
MKQFKSVILSSLLIVMILAACTPAQQSTAVSSPTPASISFVDGLKRTVDLPQPAQRVVSLAPSLTEVLFAVGAGSQVVGRDSFSNYPESVKTLPDVGGNNANYNYEAIAALKPDLVLATEINTVDQVNAIEKLGLKVVYLSNPVKLEDMYTLLSDVALLTGHTAEADSLIASLKSRVAVVESTISQAKTTPLVFYELDGSDPAKPWTPGAGTFLDQLITAAGGRNVGAVMKDAWGQLSLEQLLLQNPDIILLGDSIYGTTPEAVAARTGWGDLKAVKDGQVFAFNDDLVSRPGPRLVDGLEALARLIHPELFK